MATREGIYVGGHEIVQRYVGNRLVWEKNRYILLGTNIYGDWNNDGYTTVKQSNRENRYQDYGVQTLERVVMIKVGNETFFPSKVTMVQKNSHTTHDEGWTTRVDNYQYEMITFKNSTDRDKFIMLANKGNHVLYYGKKR